MKKYFFCLLPQEKASLHSKVKSLPRITGSAQIILPLHLTLYYLAELDENQLSAAQQWLDHAAESIPESITAETGELSSFTRGGREYVFYLPIKSDVIQKLNSQLFNLFKHFHKDEFSFVPHISVFFPKNALPEIDKKLIRTKFQKITHITFDKLALASENDGNIWLEKTINLL